MRIGEKIRPTGDSSLIVVKVMIGEESRIRHGWERRTGELVTAGAGTTAGGKILIDVKIKLIVVGSKLLVTRN